MTKVDIIRDIIKEEVEICLFLLFPHNNRANK
jgi:hypothetical protein